MSERFDAVVIGGGPAGATAAALLARGGWRVAVIERACYPRRKVCGEYLSATNAPLLEALGLTERFRALAGPPVRTVGLFAGETALAAPLPRPARFAAGDLGGSGRALRRERLDALLLDRARELGAEVLQPWAAEGLRREGEVHLVRAASHATGERIDLTAPVVIAAHGSWEPGPLPTQPARAAARPSDLLAFKAHFTGAALDEGLMPLLVFTGGYGGLVRADEGRVTLSACIRRDLLARLPRGPAGSAGEAVLDHILHSIPALRPVLAPAEREGPWLAAGPIRPGLRPGYRDGVFAAGNAAGEAHPAVAEGISMAMQSAWLLAGRLLRAPDRARRLAARAAAGREYSVLYRRSFAGRIRASGAVAQLAMRPRGAAIALPLIRRHPWLLTLGARLAGKAAMVGAR